LATGYEFEVVANLTSNWRLTCNYAIPELNANNRYPETQKYLAQNYDALKQILLDTGAVIDPATKRAVNPGVTTAESPDIANAIASWNWVEDSLVAFAANVPIVTNSYKYTANIYTDYRFSRGFLKNLRVGGGVQFRSEIRIADRSLDTIVNPANPLTAIDDPNVGSQTPVEMEAYHLFTATLGYELKLREKMRLGLNLNVSNVANWRGPIYNYSTTRPPKGDITSPARVTSLAGYFFEPRTYTLSARLNF
jgi:outer membrane receptor for ferric coprogen and ferric-rhodotorulic acid